MLGAESVWACFIVSLMRLVALSSGLIVQKKKLENAAAHLAPAALASEGECAGAGVELCAGIRALTVSIADYTR